MEREGGRREKLNPTISFSFTSCSFPAYLPPVANLSMDSMALLMV